MKLFPPALIATLSLMTTAALAGPILGGSTRPGTPGISPSLDGHCPDCVCNANGILEAWDPDATGISANGEEPGINVRRCAEYNNGATSGVCEPGQMFNIYEDPAPAITSPKCGPIWD